MRVLVKTWVSDSDFDCLPTLDYREEKIKQGVSVLALFFQSYELLSRKPPHILHVS